VSRRTDTAIHAGIRLVEATSLTFWAKKCCTCVIRERYADDDDDNNAGIEVQSNTEERKGIMPFQKAVGW
jgi:hypothetical protein